jgi:adenylyltransferase/sulfurtransferase
MKSVTVCIPVSLRSLTGGANEVVVQAVTVREAIAALGHREITNRILTPDGQIRGFVNIFLDQENVKNLDGLETELVDGGDLLIVLSVAGG